MNVSKPLPHFVSLPIRNAKNFKSGEQDAGEEPLFAALFRAVMVVWWVDLVAECRSQSGPSAQRSARKYHHAMTPEIFWGGVGATCLGSLIGAYIGSRLTYTFQRKLLNQQLEFQKEQARLDAEQRKEIAEQVTEMIRYAGERIRTSVGGVARKISNPQAPDQKS